MGMVIVRSSETSVHTYQTVCFLTQVATTQYEIKVFRSDGSLLILQTANPVQNFSQ